jgi:hypothetical protein
MTGKGLYAAIERDGVTRTVVVAAESFKVITTDPAACVSRRAVEGAAADLRRVVVRPANDKERAYERVLDGWMEEGLQTSTDPEIRDAVAQTRTGLSKALDDLARFLTEQKAEAVVVSKDWPENWPHDSLQRVLGTVTLEFVLGSGATVELSLVRFDNQGDRLAVHSGSVWRLFPAEDGAAQTLVSWLGRR